MSKFSLEKINEVLSRGVEAVYPSRTALEKVLLSGKKLRIYNGIDPTGKLQIGHGVILNKLRQFQDLGHEIIILIGDFTAMIGDPTDKAATRKQLTRKEVLDNTKNYKELIGRVLDLKKTEFKYNSQWLDKLSFFEVVNLASEFSVQRLLERDMFEKRMKEGKIIHLHEFLYPIMQAYDCVAMDVDLEIGGNDQTFNMLAGRTLMKKIKDKEKFVLAMKLLQDPTGKKMGKTEGNAISLTDQPGDMYGKVMSWTDGMIVPAFEIATNIDWEESKQVAKDLKNGKNPKILKMLLAYTVVKMYHGAEAAIKAEEQFKQVFEQGLNPDEIKKLKIKSKNIIDILIETKLAGSRSEARRLLGQGGIKVDTKTIKDENFKIEKIDKDGVVVQKGKRHFVKLVN